MTQSPPPTDFPILQRLLKLWVLSLTTAENLKNVTCTVSVRKDGKDVVPPIVLQPEIGECEVHFQQMFSFMLPSDIDQGTAEVSIELTEKRMLRTHKYGGAVINFDEFINGPSADQRHEAIDGEISSGKAVLVAKSLTKPESKKNPNNRGTFCCQRVAFPLLLRHATATFDAGQTRRGEERSETEEASGNDRDRKHLKHDERERESEGEGEGGREERWIEREAGRQGEKVGDREGGRGRGRGRMVGESIGIGQTVDPGQTVDSDQPVESGQRNTADSVVKPGGCCSSRALTRSGTLCPIGALLPPYAYYSTPLVLTLCKILCVPHSSLSYPRSVPSYRPWYSGVAS
eukprot:623174-Rhodomonas_salina.2